VAKPSTARFNHVAMSMPADALDETGRRAIIDFYSEVFGWQELPTETVDRHKLVLMVYRVDQFVFLIAEDDPMKAPRLDHFGLGVDSEEELDAFLARARAFQEKDPRVDIIDKSVEVYPGLSITNFYVRHLLPMMVEVQYFNFDRPAPQPQG
jgi:hypothetical protein